MERVKCRVCKNSDGKRCVVKDVKVAQNKSRTCTEFDYAPEKINVKKSIPSTYVPFYARSRKEYKRHIQKEVEKSLKQETITAPDCLANFRSTASED